MLDTNRIAFFSGEQSVAQPFASAFAKQPEIEFRVSDRSLTQMNGTAVEFARSFGSIVFRTEQEIDQDVLAVTQLRRSMGDDMVIVALTDGATSLSDAQRLFDAGVDDVLTDTITPDALLRQIKRAARPQNALVPFAPNEDDGKVIAVMPARGGIGSTTVATNLADRLLERKGMKKIARKKVAILDLDLQFGSVATFVDVVPGEGLYKMATDNILPDETFVKQSVSQSRSGLTVFAAPSRIVPMEAINAEQVKALIEVLRKTHDYVVIDLPRALVGWMSGVLEACDKLLLVTDSTVPSIRQSRRLLDMFTEEHLQLPVDIVVGRESKPLLLGAHHKEAVKLLERPLRYWIPFDPKPARMAIDSGTPLARSSKLRKSIDGIGRDLISEVALNKKNASR